MTQQAATSATEIVHPHQEMWNQALIHYDAKDFDRAREISDQLLRIAPGEHANLQLAGVIATAQHRLPEAAKFLKQALQCAPDAQDAAASWCALGKALRKAGDFRQAEEAFRRAIRLDPGVCGYANELARTYADGWKFDHSVEVLRQAIRHFPTNPTPCAMLGSILSEYGRQQDALIAYDLAIKRSPDSASIHLVRGVTLKMLGRFAEAEIEITEALRLNPMIDAYHHLAQLTKFTADAPEVAEMKQQLEPDSNAPLDTRIDTGFALARIYDQLGDYRTAFQYLNDANCLKRENVNRLKRETVHSPTLITEYAEMLDRIMALFTPDFFARYSGKSSSDLAPIFILGMPRSGTTLVEQMLASHSQVLGGGELSGIIKVAKDLGNTWESRGDLAPGSDELVANDLAHAAAVYAQLTAHLWQRRPRFTDKMPINFLYIGIIQLLFPKASIIYCRRDPIATCFSCYQTLFADQNILFSYNLMDLGRFYNLHLRMMEHWREVLPDIFLEVNYESVVENPELEIRRMLEFCGLEFEPACLNFHALNRPIATASLMQVRKPVYKESIDHWKNYAQYLGQLHDALGINPSTNKLP